LQIMDVLANLCFAILFLSWVPVWLCACLVAFLMHSAFAFRGAEAMQ